MLLEELEEKWFGGLYDGGLPYDDDDPDDPDPDDPDPDDPDPDDPDPDDPDPDDPDPDKDKDKQVPLSALKKVRTELQDAKDQLSTATQQLQIYAANTGKTKEKEVVDPVFGKLADTDVLTVADAKKIMSANDLKGNAVLSELQMNVQHKDYNEVINKNLPNVIKQRPDLAMAIKTSANPFVLAYELGKNDPEYLKKNSTKKQDETAKKIIANAKKLKSVNSVAGTAGDKNALKSIMDMSSEKLEARIAAIKQNA